LSSRNENTNMPLSYRTIHGYGEETIIIKKSRFIGYAMPVEDEGQALAFIESIQKKHWDATHNCYAYVVGPHDEIQKSNDDGEPSGTAGKPILEVIKKEQIKNVAVVVTRYFGGIMLGAGGLIRAYGSTAAAGLHAAGIIRRELYQALLVTIDYTWHGKLENTIALQPDWLLAENEFTDRVTMHVHVPMDDVDSFSKTITNITNGQAQIKMSDPLYVSLPCE
jgi:uncharacterized YigZ family protein